MRIWFSPLSRHLRCDCCLVSAAFLLAREVSRGLVIRIAKKLKWNPGSFCRDRRERSEHAQEETKVSSVSVRPQQQRAHSSATWWRCYNFVHVKPASAVKGSFRTTLVDQFWRFFGFYAHAVARRVACLRVARRADTE